jgi:plasmid maintenance system antidote protein VapI
MIQLQNAAGADNSTDHSKALHNSNITTPLRDTHLEILRSVFDERRRRNPRYSLRGFARHLRVDPSALSRILAGKQSVSVAVAQCMVQALGLSEEENKAFLDSVIDCYRERAARALQSPYRSPRAARDPETSAPPSWHTLMAETLRTDDCRSLEDMLGKVRSQFSSLAQTTEARIQAHIQIQVRNEMLMMKVEPELRSGSRSVEPELRSGSRPIEEGSTQEDSPPK